MKFDVDVVVVGAGPNGLTAAAAMASKGLDVQVFELANEPGGGTPTACGVPVVSALGLNSTVVGNLSSNPVGRAGALTCSEYSFGDAVYSLRIEERTNVIVRAFEPGVMGRSVAVALRRDCDDPSTEFACDDDGGPTGNSGGRIETVLEPGDYYVVVAATGLTRDPDYQLSVTTP